jgi:hypothetical protein
MEHGVHVLTEWVMSNNFCGFYNELTKKLLRITKQMVTHWRTNNSGDKIKLLVSMISLPYPSVRNIPHMRFAVNAILSNAAEAGCMLETALAEPDQEERVQHCLSCIVELQRQKEKLSNQLKYAILERKYNKKRRREETTGRVGWGNPYDVSNISSDDD